MGVILLICLAFNAILDFIYQHHHHQLQSWGLNFLQPRFLQNYADAVSQKGAPLNNCFRFVDGTLISICRPSLNQRQVYNGQKRVHGIKFQSIVLPNGLIGNLVGPWEGRRHDYTILHESGLLNELQRITWFNGHPLCVYGDPAYPMQIHLQVPCKEGNLTRDQENYNKAMKKVRVAVESLFGEIKTYFNLLSSKLN